MCAHNAEKLDGSGDPSVLTGAYASLGAHKRGARIFFGYFSPCAERVYLVGSFNGWSNSHPLERASEGIWTVCLRASEVSDGDAYKFKVIKSGKEYYYTDPYALETDGAPHFNSVYRDILTGGSEMNASERKVGCIGRPLNIYEIRANEWLMDRQGCASDYSHLANELLPYMLQMGYSHVSLSGVLEQYYDFPEYRAAEAYFAPNSGQGGAEALKNFVHTLHKAGIGVLIDWHTQRSFGSRDADIAFYTQNALYWLDFFGLDGIVLDPSDILDIELFKAVVKSVKRERTGAYIISKGGSNCDLPTDTSVRSSGCMCELFGEPDGPNDRLGINASAMAYLLMEDGRMLTCMGDEIGTACSVPFDPCVFDRSQYARFQMFCSELNYIYLSNSCLWQCSECPQDVRAQDRNGIRLLRRITCDGELILACDLTGSGGEAIIGSGEWRVLLDSAGTIGLADRASVQTVCGETYIKLSAYGSAMLEKVNI